MQAAGPLGSALRCPLPGRAGECKPIPIKGCKAAGAAAGAKPSGNGAGSNRQTGHGGVPNPPTSPRRAVARDKRTGINRMGGPRPVPGRWLAPQIAGATGRKMVGCFWNPPRHGPGPAAVDCATVAGEPHEAPACGKQCGDQCILKRLYFQFGLRDDNGDGFSKSGKRLLVGLRGEVFCGRLHTDPGRNVQTSSQLVRRVVALVAEAGGLPHVLHQVVGTLDHQELKRPPHRSRAWLIEHVLA
jgi:hypothetical protein